MLVLCIPAVVCFLFLIILLSLWQNVSPHMTYSAPSSGIQFPVLCWVHWEASVLPYFSSNTPMALGVPSDCHSLNSALLQTSCHSKLSHYSRKPALLSLFRPDKGHGEAQRPSWEKPLRPLIRVASMGYHVRGQGREGRMGRRKERVVFKTRRRWTDTGKLCRKVLIVGH